MRIAPVLDSCFRAILDKPCWNVRQGYGSFLTLEFGKPHLKTREPVKPRGKSSRRVREMWARRNVTVRGEWHLWIYCCDWTIRRGRRTIGSSISPDDVIREAADFLDGQKLTQATFHHRGCRSVFEFDLGGRLETKPYDGESEQWMLFEPCGHVLTLRADKHYCRALGNTQPDHHKWLPAWKE